jgi:uncharacterized protein YndB with AHSA1/START domain
LYEEIAMRKKILITLGVLLGIVVVLAGVVAMQPNTFRVVRSATMAAPPDKVFAQVNDFHNWEAWSPWAEKDRDAKSTYGGPTMGEGATFAWDGNDEVGAGKMTILESKPNELIKIKLEFSRPMQDASTTEFTFTPVAGGTEVKWDMYGDHTFMSKAFCMFMNMDKMVGGDFEKGLANIKKIAEAERNPPAENADATASAEG